MDWQFFVQAAIAMVVITAPPDPAKILLFNSTIERQGRNRSAAAWLVAGIVFGILAVSALVGRELLELLGINLDAFSVVGGLVIAGMGLEMLYGGAPSRAQGGKERSKLAESSSAAASGAANPGTASTETTGAASGPTGTASPGAIGERTAQARVPEPAATDEDEGLIMPLSTPLIAGPGAIVTIITISSIDDGLGTLMAALVAAAVVAVVTFASFRWLGDAISRLSPRATALLMRLGGLLLATIGTQMMLGGLKAFFAS